MRLTPIHILLLVALQGSPVGRAFFFNRDTDSAILAQSEFHPLDVYVPHEPKPTVQRTSIRSGDIVTYTIPGTKVSFDLVGVTGGQFKMGRSSTADRTAGDASPQVDVTVSDFLIGRYEVTYDEYAIFQYANRDSDSTAVAGRRLDIDAVARPSTPYEDPSFGMGGFGFPAVGMTQWAALHYARWLTEKTGQFFRLPTEAEWEYACRAGTGEEFSIGGSEPDVSAVAWHEDNSDYRLHHVGEKQPNLWGLYDMHGNAAEWMLDQYDATFYEEISASDGRDPWREPESLHPRTVRGGSYGDSIDELGCSVRRESSMNWKRRDPQIPKSFWWNTDSPFVGFRLVRPLNPPSPEDQEAFWQMVLGE